MSTDFSFLRPQKAKALKRWYESEFYKKKDLCIERYENATILPLEERNKGSLQFGLGGVVVNGVFIQNSGIEKRVGGYYSHTVQKRREEKVVFCGALIRQWGHFLVESVARLWYYLEQDISINNYVFISNSSNFNDKGQINGNYREFFELLGVWDKLEIIKEPTSFREVLIPELGYSRKYYYSEEYKEMFNRVVRNALSGSSNIQTYDKVFLSRSQLEKAIQKECGIELLDHYFEKNGY